ncbi:hypothetical protein [Halopiger xanaduensis]|uniref:DUF7978 domain-containing protein n=1 Tax=Halopiger xanaduensis (strain DSM 18323 / JCM 14033 / SH-6) TaxID=797210 RepID=F8DCW5_HALXS|nr:hypothetical protein [Halopiger xanaduensis]AEH38433.1 hypothetical protein Halxa_3828 [Halopiger xanaduensis SH-6]
MSFPPSDADAAETTDGTAAETGLPVLAGAATGLGAWLVGYAVTYLLVANDVRESSLQRMIEGLGGEPATYEMVGWVFYNAHLAETVFRNVPLVGSRATSYIGGENGFTVALYAVPVATLLVAGLALAVYRGSSAPTDGLLAGLTALPGYLVAAVAGVFLFEVTVGNAAGGPDALPAVILAGLLFPAVCASVGGVVGAVVVDRVRSDR